MKPRSACRCRSELPHGTNWPWGSRESSTGHKTSDFGAGSKTPHPFPVHYKRLLFAIFICHRCCLLANGKRTARTTFSLPSEQCKGATGIARQMVFEWYTEPLPLGPLWRSCFGLLLVRVGGCCVICDYSIIILIILPCFRTIVSAFFNFYTHWVVTQAFFSLC